MRGMRAGRRSSVGGFSLLEVLIALVVLGFGLLGYALLQTMNLRFTQSANQRTQDHITVVGVAAPEVEVGDVQPAESHDRRSAQTGKGCRTGGLIGRTSF